MTLLDVHAHLYPERYLQVLRNHSDIDYEIVPGSHESYVLSGGLALWLSNPQASLGDRIQTMDDASIDRQLISLGPLGVGFLEPEEGSELARNVNDEFLAMTSDEPGRFGVLATLPLQDVQASVVELSRLAPDTSVLGIGATTTINGMSLMDRRFDPIWEVLDERSAIVLIHPTRGQAPYTGPHPDAALAVGFPHASIEAFLALVLAGHHRRYPRIKWVFCHLGGGVAALWDRVISSLIRIGVVSSGQALLAEITDHVYFDSVSTHAPALRCFIETIGVGSLVLGTDYPHVPSAAIMKTIHDEDVSGAVYSALSSNGEALLNGSQ
jgi:aminocarboxymuconate-semialdehyde decarboxylase